MASDWSEESFACPVCLDTLKDPATLPCGHSYCLACIKSHWDKGDSTGESSCPQCRQVFNPRPSLSKSTLLVEAMEKLRTTSLKRSSAPPSTPVYLELLPDTRPRQASVYPQLPSVEPRICPQHKQILDLFCHEDKECLCEECFHQGHKGHHVLRPQEERKERQKELVEMQSEVEKRIQRTERKLKELPHSARQHKALIQALQNESTDLFSELVKNVSLTGSQVDELLRGHEASLGSQVEVQIHRMEQEVVQLRWKNEELSRLADMQDDVCFLKNFFTVEPPSQTGSSGESMLNQEEDLITSIRSDMKELQDSVQDLLKASLDKIRTLVNSDSLTLSPDGSSSSSSASSSSSSSSSAETTTADRSGPTAVQSSVNESTINAPPLPPLRPEASAPPAPFAPPRPQASSVKSPGLANPEPRTREEMIKFRFEPTMDPNTAYRHVQLSDGGFKATMKAENLNPPDHPERFQFWRQVLCREPLAGSPYYWEVEWSGQKVTIGVSYKDIERKGSDDRSRLGHNAQSWSLYWSGTGFSFWHDNKEKLLGSPKSRRIGVYLDQHAGILSFYSISNNEANLIHRHKEDFSGPLFPGFRFWAGVGNTVTICPLD